MTNETNSENSRLDRANALGLAFQRTILTLNGGAILALVAFIGSTSTQTGITIPLQSIKYALAMFLVGLFGVLFALLVSYSYTATHPENSYAKFWDSRIITLNSVAGLLAVLAFASGVLTILIGTIEIT